MSWHQLDDLGDDVFEQAPITIVNELSVPGTREQVWEALAADDAPASWSKLVTASEWHTPPGLGATRHVRLAGVLSLREVFYRWEENSRMTFRAEATSLPGIKAFGEDYVLSDRPGGGTDLRWVVAMVPVIGGSAAGQAAAMLLKPGIGDLASGLRRRVLRGQNA